MFCPKCGKEISPDEQFCWNCGTENKRFVSQMQEKEPEMKTVQVTQPIEANYQSQMAQPIEANYQSQVAQPTEVNHQNQVAQPTEVVQPAQRIQSTEAVQTVTSMQAAEESGVPERDGRYLQEQDINKLAQELQKMVPEAVPADSVSYDYRSLPSEKESGIKSFYIFDFLSGLTGKSNIPLCIFLVLNVLIIGIICSLFLTLPVPWGILSGVLLYGASVTVALSPIGEFIIRNQNNCREIMDVATVNRLKPIFDEVYYKAKKKNPKISGDVRLFMNDDEAPNAFATGRKTVCITRGLLDYDDETIKSILAHEFGHLSHKDTDRILVVAIGNVVITGITTLFQIGVIFFHCMMSIVALFMDAEDGFWVSIFSAFASFLSLIFVRGVMKVWTALGVALCMKTSRSNEYEADEFAFSLGYGASLCAFLSNLSDARPQGLFASLASSHPEPTDRVERLLQLAQEKVLLEVE